MFYRKTDATMEILTMCEIGVKFDRGKDENKHAPIRCSGEHFLNLSAALFTNGAKLKDDFEIIKKRLVQLLEVRAYHFMWRAGRRSSVSTCRIAIEAIKMTSYNFEEASYLSENKW